LSSESHWHFGLGRPIGADWPAAHAKVARSEARRSRGSSPPTPRCPGSACNPMKRHACLTCGPRRVASYWSTSWNQVNFGGTTRADTFVADQSLSLSNERGTYADW